MGSFVEHCFAFVGGGLGLFMGLFLGALDNPIMQEEMTTRQQLVYQAKQMGRRSWSSCKTFAVMGLVFSAAECVVEKVNLTLKMITIWGSMCPFYNFPVKFW